MPKKLENIQANSKTQSHGGARKGAGRKPGAATRKTREIADKAAASGATPLEVMLAAMSAFVTEAKKVKKDDPELRLKLMVAAASVAKDAAPYVHPRLQAIEHTGRDGGPMQYEQALLEVASRLL